MIRRYTTESTLLSAALCALTATGCAATAVNTPVERPQAPTVQREVLTAFRCDEARADTPEAKRREREERALALKLDLKADHVRFVRHGSQTDDEMFAARGEACATATDKATCETELARLETTARAKTQVFAITIAGDALRLYEGADVLALLGEVDNADKAWTALMIHADVPSYMCNEPDWHGYRETADGYELAWVWIDKVCRPFQRVQAIERVDRAGSVTRLRTHVVEHDAGACIIDERPVHRGHDHSAKPQGQQQESTDPSQPSDPNVRRSIIR
jgi:hypothetical protein